MISSVKKIGFIALFSLIGTLSMSAQNAPTQTAPTTTVKADKIMHGKKMSGDMKTMPLKEHVCTAACTAGKHAFVHGEKGHVCDAKCAKM